MKNSCCHSIIEVPLRSAQRMVTNNTDTHLFPPKGLKNEDGTKICKKRDRKGLFLNLIKNIF
jgi:hypothetical protein